MKLRILLLGLTALPLALGGCATVQSSAPNNQEVLEAHLNSRTLMLQLLDDAFFRLGREYFTLQSEYKEMGNMEMADLIGRQAQQFHKTHLKIQDKLKETSEEQVVLERGGEVILPSDDDLVLDDVPLQAIESRVE